MLSAAFLAAADNPLELNCYQQSFSVTFPSVEAAAAAQLTPRGLPEKYDVAFSSRWDDNTNNHFNTHKVMKKYGAKGNFYFNGNMSREMPVKLMSDGCLAGAHTVSHPAMNYLIANCHFYQYMANRIAIEVQTQTPVNTQTSPFGHCKGYGKEGLRSIGKSVLATGIIGSPDSGSPQHIRDWGFPENSCAFMYRVVPGDRVPDMKKLDAVLATHLSKPEFKKDPAISMSTHSWHTREGLVILDEVYKKLTSNKNWWNCNQNEYAAYRYEALNTEVKKEVTGKTVKFTVLRFEPFELGADVPLYFDITGSAAISADGAELTDNGKQLKAKHADGHKLPDKYGYLKLDKVSLKLAVSESDGKMTAVVENTTGSKLSDVTYIFRKPPMYGKTVERKAVKSVDKVDSTTADLGKVTEKSRHFQEGKPYYAVQMDYSLDGKRYRLYADCFTSERKTQEKAIGDAAVFIQRDKGPFDLKAVSVTEASLSGLKFITKTDDIITVPGTIFLQKLDSYGYVAVVDIESEKEQKLSVNLRISQNSRMFFNGTQIKPARKAVITFRKGINRLAVEGRKKDKVTLFDIKGNVRYLTPCTK